MYVCMYENSEENGEVEVGKYKMTKKNRFKASRKCFREMTDVRLLEQISR